MTKDEQSQKLTTSSNGAHTEVSPREREKSTSRRSKSDKNAVTDGKTKKKAKKVVFHELEAAGVVEGGSERDETIAQCIAALRHAMEDDRLHQRSSSSPSSSDHDSGGGGGAAAVPTSSNSTLDGLCLTLVGNLVGSLHPRTPSAVGVPEVAIRLVAHKPQASSPPPLTPPVREGGTTPLSRSSSTNRSRGIGSPAVERLSVTQADGAAAANRTSSSNSRKGKAIQDSAAVPTKSILALDHRTGSRKLDALFGGPASSASSPNDYYAVVCRCVKWLVSHPPLDGSPITPAYLSENVSIQLLGMGRINSSIAYESPSQQPQLEATSTTPAVEVSCTEASPEGTAASKKPSEGQIVKQLFPSCDPLSPSPPPVFIKLDVSHCMLTSKDAATTPLVTIVTTPDGVDEDEARQVAKVGEVEMVRSILATLLRVPAYLSSCKSLAVTDLLRTSSEKGSDTVSVVEVNVIATPSLKTSTFIPPSSAVLAEAALARRLLPRNPTSSPAASPPSPIEDQKPPSKPVVVTVREIVSGAVCAPLDHHAPAARSSLGTLDMGSDSLHNKDQFPELAVPNNPHTHNGTNPTSIIRFPPTEPSRIVIPTRRGTEVSILTDGEYSNVEGGEQQSTEFATPIRSGALRRRSTPSNLPRPPNIESSMNQNNRYDGAGSSSHGSQLGSGDMEVARSVILSQGGSDVDGPLDAATTTNNDMMPLSEGCHLPDPFPADLISDIREKQAKIMRRTENQKRRHKNSQQAKSISRTAGSSTRQPSHASCAGESKAGTTMGSAVHLVIGVTDSASPEFDDSHSTDDDDEEDTSDSGRNESSRSINNGSASGDFTGLVAATSGNFSSSTTTVSRTPSVNSKKMRARARVVDQWRAMVVKRDTHCIREETHFSQNKETIYQLVSDLGDRDSGIKEAPVDMDRLQLAEVLYGLRYVREYCLSSLQYAIEVVDSNNSGSAMPPLWSTTASTRSSSKFSRDGEGGGGIEGAHSGMIGRGFKGLSTPGSGSTGTPGGNPENRRGSIASISGSDSAKQSTFTPGRSIGRRGRVSISIAPGSNPIFAEPPPEAHEQESNTSSTSASDGQTRGLASPDRGGLRSDKSRSRPQSVASTHSLLVEGSVGANESSTLRPFAQSPAPTSSSITGRNRTKNMVKLPPLEECEDYHHMPPRVSPTHSSINNATFAFCQDGGAQPTGMSFASNGGESSSLSSSRFPQPDHRQIAYSEFETDEERLSTLHRSFSVVQNLPKSNANPKPNSGIMRWTSEKPPALIHLEKSRSVAGRSTANKSVTGSSTNPEQTSTSSTSNYDPMYAISQHPKESQHEDYSSPDQNTPTVTTAVPPRGATAIQPNPSNPLAIGAGGASPGDDAFSTGVGAYDSIPLVEEAGSLSISSSDDEGSSRREKIARAAMTPGPASHHLPNDAPPAMSTFEAVSDGTYAKDSGQEGSMLSSITSLASRRRITLNTLDRTSSLSVIRHHQQNRQHNIGTNNNNTSSHNMSTTNSPKGAGGGSRGRSAFHDALSNSQRVSPASPYLQVASPRPGAVAPENIVQRTGMHTSARHRSQSMKDAMLAKPATISTSSYLPYLYGDLAPAVLARLQYVPSRLLHADHTTAGAATLDVPGHEDMNGSSQTSTAVSAAGSITPRERTRMDHEMLEMILGNDTAVSSPNSTTSIPHSEPRNGVVPMFSFSPTSTPRRHQLTQHVLGQVGSNGKLRRSDSETSNTPSAFSDATAPFLDGPTSSDDPFGSSNHTAAGIGSPVGSDLGHSVLGHIDHDDHRPPSSSLAKRGSDASQASEGSIGKSSVTSYSSVTYNARVSGVSPRTRTFSEIEVGSAQPAPLEINKFPANFNPHIMPLSNAYRDDDMISTFSITPEMRKQTKHTEQLVKQEDEDEGYIMVNDYILLELKGEGQYGEVHLVVDNSPEAIARQQEECLDDNELYRAMKIISKNKLRKRYGANDKATLALEKEIAVMKRLHHRNIVPLEEVINDPDDPFIYLVMPYIDRGPVIHIDPATGCYGPPLLHISTIRKYIRQVTAALVYLHRQGVCHMDLKPDNMLLGTTRKRKGDLLSSGGAVGLGNSTNNLIDNEDDTTLFLSDFGVSEIFAADEEEADEDHHTLTPEEDGLLSTNRHNRTDEGGPRKVIIRSTDGTPAYVAPEALTGEPFNAMPIDMWAVGVTTYLFLYGHHPFSGGTIPQLFDSIRDNRPQYALPAVSEQEERIHYNMDSDHIHDEPPMTEAAFQEQRIADKNARADCLDLIQKLLETDPTKRLTAVQCRHHKFLSKTTPFGGFNRPSTASPTTTIPVQEQPISSPLVGTNNPSSPNTTRQSSSSKYGPQEIIGLVSDIYTPTASVLDDGGGGGSCSAGALPSMSPLGVLAESRRGSNSSTSPPLLSRPDLSDQHFGSMRSIRLAYTQQQKRQTGGGGGSGGSTSSQQTTSPQSSSAMYSAGRIGGGSMSGHQRPSTSNAGVNGGYEFPAEGSGGQSNAAGDMSDSISSVATDDSIGTMEDKVARKNAQDIRRAARDARRRQEKLDARRAAAATAGVNRGGTSGGIVSNGVGSTFGKEIVSLNASPASSPHGSTGSKPSQGGALYTPSTPHSPYRGAASYSPLHNTDSSQPRGSGSMSSSSTSNPMVNNSNLVSHVAAPQGVGRDGSVVHTMSFNSDGRRVRETSHSSATSVASMGGSINQRFMFGGGSTASFSQHGGDNIMGRAGGPSGLLKRRRRQVATANNVVSNRPSVIDSTLGYSGSVVANGIVNNNDPGNAKNTGGNRSSMSVNSTYGSPRGSVSTLQPRVVSGSAAAAVRAANSRQRNSPGKGLATINMSVMNNFGPNVPQPPTLSTGAPVIRPSTAQPIDHGGAMAGSPAVGLRGASHKPSSGGKQSTEEDAALAMHLT